MKKVVILMLSLTIGWSSAVFAEGADESCNDVLRNEVESWQSKTGFFKIGITSSPGEGHRDRENAMSLIKETMEDIDLEQCSDALLDEVWVLKYHLNNYFAANEGMLEMREEIEAVNEVSELEPEVKERYRTLYSERAIAYGTFVTTLVKVFDELNIVPEFE